MLLDATKYQVSRDAFYYRYDISISSYYYKVCVYKVWADVKISTDISD